MFDPLEIIGYAYALVLCLIAWIRREMRERAGQSWPVVNGTLESALQSAMHGQRCVEVRYSYSVEGDYYSGLFFRFVLSESEGDQVIERLPRLSQLLVHYKPTAPDTSVLDLHQIQSRLAATPILTD